MRGIASRLSVTTGALYRYYTDKESLFDVLVEEPARVLEERYRAIQKGFADQPVDAQVQTLPEVSDEGYSEGVAGVAGQRRQLIHHGGIHDVGG